MGTVCKNALGDSALANARKVTAESAALLSVVRNNSRKRMYTRLLCSCPVCIQNYHNAIASHQKRFDYDSAGQ